MRTHVDFLLAILVVVVSLFLSTYFVRAYDPNPLQDFCVAITYDPKYVDDQAKFVNGRLCKNPKLVSSNDFFYSGLHNRANTSNIVGSNVTAVTVDKVPGLNTLGVLLARYDFAPYGVNPPHYHTRASEIFMVTKGTVYVGFVSSNRLFGRILRKGDVFVFPIGMIHFQYNYIRDEPAVAYAGFSSQYPGVVRMGNVLFGSNPPIFPEILVRAFQLNRDVIACLQSREWIENST